MVLNMCRTIGYKLIQEVIVYNRTSLPTPIQYTSLEPIRLKNAVSKNLWFSKSDRPYADNRKVLRPYSEYTLKEFKDKKEYTYNTPSGNNVNIGNFSRNRNGSIPTNILIISNSKTN